MNADMCSGDATPDRRGAGVARQFGWQDMFVRSEDDPRGIGGVFVHHGDERTVLEGYLRDYRLTLELKCAGLDADAMARRSVEPSDLSLLGLVRHLADAERIVAAAAGDLGDARPYVGRGGHRGEVSLREVLVHMVEEYARRIGHADLLRERIDGRVGL